MKSYLIGIFFVATIFITFTCGTVTATGTYGEYGQYGTTTVSNAILIDKLVSKPGTETRNGVTDMNYAEYYDNLSPSDAHFSPNQIVFFKLRVKNTSNVKQYNINVTDYVPSYVEPVEGPGTYDSNARKINFNAGDFEVNEEKTYFFKMQVTNANNLPSDRSLVCLVNKAEAKNDNVFDDDSAQFCIEKQSGGVTGVTMVPSTGPEYGLVLLGLEAATLGFGFFLKKRTK